MGMVKGGEDDDLSFLHKIVEDSDDNEEEEAVEKNGGDSESDEEENKPMYEGYNGGETPERIFLSSFSRLKVVR